MDLMSAVVLGIVQGLTVRENLRLGLVASKDKKDEVNRITAIAEERSGFTGTFPVVASRPLADKERLRKRDRS